jgi:hypothetical protein
MRLLITLFLLVIPLGAGAKLPKVCHQCAKQCSSQVPACVQADPDLATCSTKRCLKKAKHNCKKNLTQCCVQNCKSTGEVVCCGSAASPLPTTTTSTTPGSSPTTSTPTTTAPGTPTTTLQPCTTSADCTDAAACCQPGVGCCSISQVTASAGKSPPGCAGSEYVLFQCCWDNGMPGATTDPSICPNSGTQVCPNNTSCPTEIWACGRCTDVDKQFAGYCQQTPSGLKCGFQAND